MAKLNCKLWKVKEAVKLTVYKRIYWHLERLKVAVQSGGQVWYCTIYTGEWVIGAFSQRYLVSRRSFLLQQRFSLRDLRRCPQATGISRISCPQKKKSSGLRSGERVGQITGPPCPIQRCGHVASRKCQTSAIIWAGAYFFYKKWKNYLL